MTTSTSTATQLDVERWLGRCLLGLQRYEHLLKQLLANHELAGSADGLEAQRAANFHKFSDKTLGTLVKSLFESYVVPEGFERALLSDRAQPVDGITMAVSYRVEMPPARRAEVRAGIEELVLMRNELVHHFVEQFDLSSPGGCEAAVRHLEDSYQRIEGRRQDLLAWSKSMTEAGALMAAFAQTDTFHDVIVNGIAPDGSFDWADAGIVRVLREAAGVLSEGGWTRLDSACEWACQNHPDQAPGKYGCRTWPQVLHESRQFDLIYRVGENGKKGAWFRPRG